MVLRRVAVTTIAASSFGAVALADGAASVAASVSASVAYVALLAAAARAVNTARTS